MKKNLLLLLFVFTMLLNSCGQNEFGSIRMFVNSQEQEVRINDVDCYNDPRNGDSGMTCTIFIRNANGAFDQISFIIADVINIFNNQLGQALSIQSNSLSDIRATAFGSSITVLFGSEVIFSSISNVVGNQVCSDFRVNIGAGTDSYYTGNFCARVQ